MLTYFAFRVVADDGSLVPGANCTVQAAKRLSDAAAVAGLNPPFTDFQTGDYSVGVDVDANPELLLLVAVSKSGVQIGGQNALIPVVCTRTVLSATGLDCLLPDVSSDADLRSTGAKMLRGLFDRFYNKVTNSAAQQQVCNDVGTAVITLAVSDDGSVATKARSS